MVWIAWFCAWWVAVGFVLYLLNLFQCVVFGSDKVLSPFSSVSPFSSSSGFWHFLSPLPFPWYISLWTCFLFGNSFFLALFFVTHWLISVFFSSHYICPSSQLNWCLAFCLHLLRTCSFLLTSCRLYHVITGLEKRNNCDQAHLKSSPFFPASLLWLG